VPIDKVHAQALNAAEMDVINETKNAVNTIAELIIQHCIFFTCCATLLCAKK
jgi:hypothetical protein